MRIPDSAQWIQRVRLNLLTIGYHYEPELSLRVKDSEPVICAARLLGRLYIPAGSNPSRPVIDTQPSSSAPRWRPFDRRSLIGWHNDFSTKQTRPELSLSWIEREDPEGPDKGTWLVASTAAVLAKLRQSREGVKLVTELSQHAEPFGYRDVGGWRSFRVIIRANPKLRQEGIRFYGRALENGAWLRFGRVSARTREIVARIEEAANSVREVLPAKTGSLLIVHNNLSLHDRSAQTVRGPKENRRRAILCFVDKLHRPL